LDSLFPALDLDFITDKAAPALSTLRDCRIFLTGGTGFFGSWLISSLIQANRHLNLNARLCVLSRHPAGFQKSHPHLASDPALELLAGDVRNFIWPTGDFTHVIHAATDTSVDAARQFDQLFATIVDGTRRVVDFACAKNVSKLLFTSSGAIYGPQPPQTSHLPENWLGAPDTLSPSSLYGNAKRAAEQYCSQAGSVRGLPVTIARCFAFVGPGLPLDAHFAIGNFIRDSLFRGNIAVNSGGTVLRSYLYAADLAAWLWTLLALAPAGEAYNVGSDQVISIHDLAYRVGTLLAPEKPVQISSRTTSGDRNQYVPDISKARALGLDVWTELDQAIIKTASWTQSGCGA
jgi:dTDP-glucose 4,6-dehydratase